MTINSEPQQKLIVSCFPSQVTCERNCAEGTALLCPTERGEKAVGRFRMIPHPVPRLEDPRDPRGSSIVVTRRSSPAPAPATDVVVFLTSRPARCSLLLANATRPTANERRHPSLVSSAVPWASKFGSAYSRRRGRHERAYGQRFERASASARVVDY